MYIYGYYIFICIYMYIGNAQLHDANVATVYKVHEILL